MSVNIAFVDAAQKKLNKVIEQKNRNRIEKQKQKMKLQKMKK